MVRAGSEWYDFDSFTGLGRKVAKTMDRHEVLYTEEGMVSECRCGLNFWEPLCTDNSGPNEEDVLMFAKHHVALAMFSEKPVQWRIRCNETFPLALDRRSW
jgi:hypothetical protein